MADQILSPDHAWTSRAIKSAHGHLTANQYLVSKIPPPRSSFCRVDIVERQGNVTALQKRQPL
jgi:hypothetical protein